MLRPENLSPKLASQKMLVEFQNDEHFWNLGLMDTDEGYILRYMSPMDYKPYLQSP